VTRENSPCPTDAAADEPRPAVPSGSRRALLAVAGAALVGGCEGLVAHADKPALGETGDDVALLNNALAVEYEAIAVYELLLASARLGEPGRGLAQQFREDHTKHAAALVGSILKRGGTPVEGKASYGFRPDELRTEGDALRLAETAEKSAASLYLGAVPAHFDRQLAKQAASILAVETMHWAALRQALGEDPVPAPFLG
jgi:rubrerythrin